jgi:hypothetical protein
MDPMAQLGLDFMMFNNIYGNYAQPGGLQPAFPGQLQPGLQGQMAQAGYLVPAPEDPPLRPAIILDTETLIHRMEGLFGAGFLILALIMRGIVLQTFLAVFGLFALYKYITGRAEVAAFNQQEQFRMTGRLLPAPMPPQHYVVQNVLG